MVASPARKPVEDYLIHYIIQQAERRNQAIHFHD